MSKGIILKPEDEHLLADFERAKTAHLAAIKAVQDHRAAHNGEFDEGLLDKLSDAMHAEITAIEAIRRKG